MRVENHMAGPEPFEIRLTEEEAEHLAFLLAMSNRARRPIVSDSEEKTRVELRNRLCVAGEARRTDKAIVKRNAAKVDCALAKVSDMKTLFTALATNGDIDLRDTICKKAIATLNAARENITLAKVGAMAWRIWHEDYAA